MLIQFKLLKTSTIVSAEVDETKSPDQLLEQVKGLFNITEEGTLKLIIGNQLLSNTRSLLDQRASENSTIVVTFRAKKVIPAEPIAVPTPNNKPSESKSSVQEPNEWYPRSYSDAINNVPVES